MSDYPRTRRATRTGKVALFILWAAFASIAYNIYSEVQELALINDLEALDRAGTPYGDETLARMDANDERQRRAGIGYGLAIVVATIVLLLWVSRTNRACRELGATHMQFTPGWAWGYWLIPILNFFKPYQVVRELWTTTDPEGRSSRLVGIWWAAWLFTGFAARASGNLPPEPTLQDFREANQFVLFSHGVDIVGFALTIVLVTKLTARLQAFRDRVAPLAAARVVTDKSK